MKRIYIAHINEESGAVQTVKEHSEGTAELCEAFAVKEMKEPASTVAQLHDIGKYGERFQHKIRGDSSIRVEHSGSGAVEATKLFKGPMGWMMAYCIAGHHAGLPDGGLKTDEEDEATLHGRLKRDFDEYRQYEDDIEVPEIDESAFAAFLAQDCNNDIKKLIDKFAFLTRYCFSCLTDADSIDTGRFCGSLTERELRADFGECLKRIDVKLSSFKYETELQRARKTVQEQVYQKTDLPGEVYLVNMPTGSGKTLCSLKFALEKAVKEGKKRIIYVIPYNAIADQTADEMKRIFGEHAEILRHQSSFFYEDEEGEETYSEDYRDAARVAVENWGVSTIIITTVVQFFESIYSHKKRKLRKMHNMADSVIVFDEVHLLPRKYLQPCLQAVSYITKYLNSKAVFLTATMPDFKKLIRQYALPGSDIVDLVEDRSSFDKFRKCQFRHIGNVSMEALVEKAMDKPSSLIIVNRKATARELYGMCGGRKYHLSTYMAACDRSRIIEEIRTELRKLEEDFPGLKDVPRQRRIVVVSTSLIEAGVDIDMSCVFREMMGLDSILQAGGRCNREGRREGAFTYVFELDEDECGASSDERRDITRGLFKKYDDISKPDCILEYYDRLFFVRKEEIESNTISKECSRIDGIPFRTYGENFRIIESATVSIAVDRDERSHQLMETLRSTGVTSSRKLQKYTCSVSQKEFEALVKQHAVDDYGSGIWCLTNTDYYDENTGIKFEGEDYFL